MCERKQAGTTHPERGATCRNTYAICKSIMNACTLCNNTRVCNAMCAHVVVHVLARRTTRDVLEQYKVPLMIELLAQTQRCSSTSTRSCVRSCGPTGSLAAPRQRRARCSRVACAGQHDQAALRTQGKGSLRTIRRRRGCISQRPCPPLRSPGEEGHRACCLLKPSSHETA